MKTVRQRLKAAARKIARQRERPTLTASQSGTSTMMHTSVMSSSFMGVTEDGIGFNGWVDYDRRRCAFYVNGKRVA